MSVIRELADIAQRTSVLLGFNTPADLLTLLQKMLEVSDPPGRVIEDVRAELHRQETEVGNTLRSILGSPPPNLFPCMCQGELKTTRAPCPNCIRINYPSVDQLRSATRLEGVPAEAGPPPTHLAPLVRLSDKSSTPAEPQDIAAADLWGEGNGLHSGEVVLEQSHPGSRRAAVRPVDGGIALRAVECDGQPAGGSIFLRGEAVDTLIVALNAARGVRVHDGPSLSASSMQALSVRLQQVQEADPLLFDLVTAGETRFAPAHLTARRCSPTHLQLLDEGVVTADWWPSTGKARAAGPTTGVTAPFKIFTVDALVEWLKGL